MQLIKTYNKLGEDLDVAFSLKRMQNLALEREGQPDEPHRHNFFTVIFAIEATGSHFIDFNEYVFQSPCVFFVSPGQVHQVITTGTPKGFAFLFSHDFLLKNGITPDFIYNLNLFRNYGESPPLLLDSEQTKTLTFLAQYLENVERDANKNDERRALILKLFLIECTKICTLPSVDVQHSQGVEGLLRKFRDLVEEHFQKEHSVGFYAEKLFITTGHLNKTVKSLTSNSAKEFIQKRITTEAKRMALYSHLSSKEIGFSLGFEDPAHFSNFFRNCTGMSFSAYRKELKLLNS